MVTDILELGAKIGQDKLATQLQKFYRDIQQGKTIVDEEKKPAIVEELPPENNQTMPVAD